MGDMRLGETRLRERVLLVVEDFGEDGRSERRSCGWAVMMREWGEGKRAGEELAKQGESKDKKVRKEEQDKLVK